MYQWEKRVSEIINMWENIKDNDYLKQNYNCISGFIMYIYVIYMI